MKRKKLLQELAGWFDMKDRKRRDHEQELETLLQKLKKKEEQLEAKMFREKGERRRKRLKKEIDIIRAQHPKGLDILTNLEKKYT